MCCSLTSNMVLAERWSLRYRTTLVGLKMETAEVEERFESLSLGSEVTRRAGQSHMEAAMGGPWEKGLLPEGQPDTDSVHFKIYFNDLHRILFIYLVLK